MKSAAVMDRYKQEVAKGWKTLESVVLREQREAVWSQNLVRKLRKAGYRVEPAERVPGLWNVDGRELTEGQMFSLLRQL